MKRQNDLPENIDVEVIDLRTIVPYDKALVMSSVKKAKTFNFHEDMRFMGFGAEIASDIAEHCFALSHAPISAWPRRHSRAL